VLGRDCKVGDLQIKVTEWKCDPGLPPPARVDARGLEIWVVLLVTSPRVKREDC